MNLVKVAWEEDVIWNGEDIKHKVRTLFILNLKTIVVFFTYDLATPKTVYYYYYPVRVTRLKKMKIEKFQFVSKRMNVPATM